MSSPCMSPARDPATARTLFPLALSYLCTTGELERMEDAALDLGRLELCRPGKAVLV